MVSNSKEYHDAAVGVMVYELPEDDYYIPLYPDGEVNESEYQAFATTGLTNVRTLREEIDEE